MKKRLGPIDRLYPMPCVLVVGGTLDAADTLAVAWLNIVASTPPTVAMGLRNSRNTLDLIRGPSYLLRWRTRVPQPRAESRGRLQRGRIDRRAIG